MKKVKFNKKLVLNKETISSLNNPEMARVLGGEAETLTQCAVVNSQCKNKDGKCVISTIS